MNPFSLWFTTGLEHILDLSGYDHILFVSLLVLTFSPGKWKEVLLLITAFTFGHSASLAFSVLKSFHAPQLVTEFLIALTLVTSAVFNLIFTKNPPKRVSGYLYGLVSFFGLIHGLGFSYLLRSMLGSESSIVLPLLYFNLGIEAGQIVIVSVVLLFSFLITKFTKWPFHNFKIVLVCFISVVSLKILVERLLLLLS